MKKLLSLLMLLPLATFAKVERELTAEEIRVIEESVQKASGYKDPVFKHNKLIEQGKSSGVYCGLVSEKDGDEFVFILALSRKDGELAVNEPRVDNKDTQIARNVCKKFGYYYELDRSFWNYSEDKDEMRNQSKYYAHLESENTITTSFDNEEEVGLLLRKRLKEENVYFTTDKGLFSCDPCKIAVKIDNNPIMYLNAERGERYSSLFLTNKKQRTEFVRQMKNGTKLIVELPIYNNGKQQVKFTVKGLKWEHF